AFLLQSYCRYSAIVEGSQRPDMPRRRVCTRRSLVVAVALCMVLNPGFSAADVRIESSPETAGLAQIVRGDISNASQRVAELNARVTVGPAAFLAALNDDDARPIVAAYVSSSEFTAALGSSPRNRRQITAVFSNPDPLDQLVLAKAILSRARIA